MEPTQQAKPYINPYETTVQTDPYNIPLIPPPPPPSKRGKKLWLILALVTVFILSAIMVTVFLGVGYYQGKRKATPTVAPTIIVKKTVIVETPTAIPTIPPTPTIIVETPTATVSYYANDIYNDFVDNGLGGKDPRYDTDWSCCTWVPTGRAIAWTDNSSGFKIDLAVFLNVQHAETDASQLEARGYYASVVHDCMLSYEVGVPSSTVVAYLNLMQEYCN